MTDTQGAYRPTTLIALATFALVTGILFFIKAVFMPLALAMLLTFILSPLVIRLTRGGMPKPISILTTVFLTLTIFAAIGWLVASQLISLTKKLPEYQSNLHAKIERFKKPSGDGTFSRAMAVIDGLKKDLDGTAVPANGTSPAVDPKPVPVEVKTTQPMLKTLNSLLGSVAGPIGTAGLVGILVIAMLFQREDLRERAIKLVSGGELNVATQAIDDAAQRISRYIIMNLMVNATYGIPIGVGLYFIGVPNAMLWGLLATLLRFIPFLGPWIAASFPIALAIAVDPGWSKLFMTLALFGVVELISNNVIEVWLYGQSTGISNVALMIAAIFWTWLWGVMGLFLSTPLTVCLVVMGKYIPGLKFLSDLLGSDPALSPPARFYQRMLAMDQEELLAMSQKFLAEQSLEEFYDAVVIPALIMAESDRHNGKLAEVRQQFIIQNTRELIEELGENQALKDAEEGNTPQFLPEHPVILCIPARDDVDEIAGLMLSQLLRQAGIYAKTVPVTVNGAECAIYVTPYLRAVCISALPPGAVAPARQVCKRFAGELRGLRLFAGFWGHKSSPIELEARFSNSCPSKVFTSLRVAKTELKAITDEKLCDVMMPAPIPANELERQEALNDLNVLDDSHEELFDSVTRQLAKAFDVPISLVTFVDADRQFWKAQVGLPKELAEAQEAPRETSMCGHVVAVNEVMVVEDVELDPRFANNPFLKERGIRFYAGAPLRTSSGYAVGSLCVIDTKPRKITEGEKLLIVTLAAKLMNDVESKRKEPVLV